MFPFIIPALCAAVGAAAGAIAAHSSGEKDRQKAKHLNQVNNDLINKRNELEKRYQKISETSKQQISDYQRKLVNSELEKDALYLAIRLQNDLMSLMEALDRNPSLEVIEKFQDAVVKTNLVLKELGENLVPISQDYFDRNLDRAKEKTLTEKQQFIFKENSNLASNEMLFHDRQKVAIDEILSTTLVSHVEKKTNPTIGNIACPHCHQQNEVMQKTPSIRCNTCDGFIDLVARHRQIEWNQTKLLKEKLNSSSDGSIACPLCHKSNPVTKGK